MQFRFCAPCAILWQAIPSLVCWGIMNGTTNYILDQMDTTGATFADALKDAQELGYAEAEPHR